VTGGEPNGAALAEAAADFAARRRIDPLSGLAGDRVYLFHGESHSVVATPVAAAAEAFYRAAGITAGALHTVYALPGGKAGHSLGLQKILLSRNLLTHFRNAIIEHRVVHLTADAMPSCKFST
jgi:predicted esterase